MKNIIILFALSMLLLACAREGQTIALTPFIGGTEGITIGFTSDTRAETFDGGQDPFDVVVELQNNGEKDVSSSKAKVTLSGVLPQEFNKLPEDFSQNAPEDLYAKRKTSTGVIQQSMPISAEFSELNHVSPVSGSVMPFILRAEVCYEYATQGVSKVCVRRNLQNPSENGLCEIEETKPSSSSGAPVQVGNFQETMRGSNKIGFNFDVTHEGSGRTFELGSGCEDVQSKRDKIVVRVDTKMDGLSCTGFKKVGTAVESTTTLFEGKKQITCTQEVKVPGDYELPVIVDVSYDYFEYATKEIKVKHTES